MIKTGGVFNPDDRPIYFTAVQTNDIRLSQLEEYYSNILTPMDNIRDNKAVETIERVLNSGAKLLFDSGIFSLASDYSNKNNVPLEECFNINPIEFDGFNDLFVRYKKIIGDYKDQCWGYIELDLGGQDIKTKNRQELEFQGIYPIPVYHPANDTEEYFDYLCANYDRVCIGNLVAFERSERIKCLADIRKRMLKFPETWIHLLGVSMCDLSLFFDFHSCDSSILSNVVRWLTMDNRAFLKVNGKIDEIIFRYDNQDQINHRGKNFKMSAIQILSDFKNWQNIRRYFED